MLNHKIYRFSSCWKIAPRSGFSCLICGKRNLSSISRFKKSQWWFLHKEEKPVNFLWTQRAQNTLSMMLARSCSDHFCSFSTPHTHEHSVDTVIYMRSSFIRDSDAFDQGSLILKPFHRLHTEYLSLQFPSIWHCFHPVIAVIFQWQKFPKTSTWQCIRVECSLSSTLKNCSPWEIRKFDIWYLIHLLIAIGFTPCGTSTVHIYTQTIHRTTQWNRIHRTYITIRIHKHKNKNT
jgi:hypothetical protein